MSHLIINKLSVNLKFFYTLLPIYNACTNLACFTIGSVLTALSHLIPSN